MAHLPLVRIGFLGLGTVGQGVWKHLSRERQAFERRLGVRIELVRAAVQSKRKQRSIRVPAAQLTEDPFKVVNDPDIDIVCELIGGIGIARELTLSALRAGKSVVTANKALICEHGAALFNAARRYGARYFFEASVGGGIPIIKTLCEGLVANRFPLIYGILNGSSNYILTRMEREDIPFEAVLKDARRLGYVEADESLDIDGKDAAHKAAILAYLAHGKWVPLRGMILDGIRDLAPRDFTYARELGYKIKLIARIERNLSTGELSVGVYPALVALSDVIANVDGVYNALSLTGDVVGTTVLIGRGAGQDATASAVIADIADAVLQRLGHAAVAPLLKERATAVLPSPTNRLAKPESIRGRYYVRLQVQDQTGVLAQVAKVFARNDLSIATMTQIDEAQKDTVTLALTTHTGNERQIGKTLRSLRSFKSITAPPVLLRIL